MFLDRRDAGVQLAERVAGLDLDPPVVVVGLPRGGVPVADEVARRLDAPLDVVLVRKIGVPSRPELAMGAIGEGGVIVRSEDVIAAAAITPEQFASVEQRARRELDSHALRFRGHASPIDVRDSTVVVVDDGVATGATARAACEILAARGARRVVLATPVAPPDWTNRLADVADDFVAVSTPGSFESVGSAYRDFAATSDSEVTRCLQSQR